MWEFNLAVSTLLDAFSSGIAILKQLETRRRDEGRLTTDPGVKSDETRLVKALKNNRAEVQTAYARDVVKFGNRFAEGDAKAQSSLTSILLLLNAGFVGIIDRFIKGETTRSDYKRLVNLSNTSKAEAVATFEQLSTRLSQSVVAPPNGKKDRSKVPRKSVGQRTSSSRKSVVGYSAHARSKSAPELSVKKTTLGPATPEGWVRPKAERKTSSTLTKSYSSHSSLELRSPPKSRPHPYAGSRKPKVRSPSSQVGRPRRQPVLPSPATPDNRISFISFASDSTKLGEIPDRKRARRGSRDDDGQVYSDDTAFPLAWWRQREPEKQRSRFMWLFRK